MRTVLFLALLLLSSTGQAHAQGSDDERARTHFEAGRSYYDEGRYEDAAHEFQQSFQLSNRPALLLNLSQAHERGLRFDEAIADIESFLQRVPDSPDRKTLEQRRQHLLELRARLATPAAAAPAQPQPVAPAPTATTAPATPPVTAPPAATEQTQPDKRSPLIVPGWILVGTGGGALIGSLVTGLMADSKHSTLTRQCSNGACPVTAQSTIDSGKTLALVSTVLLVVGVVAGGVGTTFLIMGSHASGEAATASAGQVRLAAGPCPLGAGAQIFF